MTWNIFGGEQSAAALEANARAAAEDLGPLDVVAVQEVISEEQVAAIARGLGLEHWVISDFSPPVDITGAWFRSLEVAVISRLPLTAAAEWDTTGREPHGDDFPPRVSDEAVPVEETPINITFGEEVPSRGFLRADLGDTWSVYTGHWKSSRGESCNAADLANAQQREDQARGFAQDMARVIQTGRTVVVAGDYNIQAPGRALRVGTDPEVDCQPAGSCDGVCGVNAEDGYDDSMHLLLSADLSTRLLSAELDETFIESFFPGGAIDHLLVAGELAPDFEMASTPSVEGNRFFGSDHRPVLATVSVGPTEPETNETRLRELLSEIMDRLVEMEALLE